ncbi:MAG: sterol desaturase family protein, partial [Tepidimonas sp.]|nr:sterol desaturase family protein [Tepidimonas sp.]
MESVTEAFAAAQQGLFETVVQPLLYQAGLASHLEEAFDGTGWFLVGLLQLAVMLLLIAPLSRWRPAERPAPDVLAERRASVRVDVIYTLIDRLGVLRVAMFFLVEPLWHALFGWLALQGFYGWQLDQWLAPLVPGVTDTALASFLLYLVVFDFVNYWIHRAQHHYRWWWALHAVHHSQRHVTMWTDSRNHLLDSVLMATVFALVARAIGVLPGQFIALVARGAPGTGAAGGAPRQRARGRHLHTDRPAGRAAGGDVLFGGAAVARAVWLAGAAGLPRLAARPVAGAARAGRHGHGAGELSSLSGR